MQAWLETTGVAGHRLRFPLDRPTVRVGSVGTSDIWIPLPGIRRLHCRIEPRDAGWLVQPTKGARVRVNDVDHDMPVPLGIGDRLAIGPMVFAVRDQAIQIEVPPVHEAPTHRPTAAS